jgi:hypothetical protein
LLITPGASLSSTLDPRVTAEIERVLPAGHTVYLLGGDLALSPAIDTALQALGYVTVREAGADEFATAVDIAQALGNPTTVFEATGLDFPDAVSAVPAAIATNGAILLTNGTSQAPETAAYLAAHPGDTRYAIGGPLAAAGADPTATAVYGPDLYATSAAVAGRFFPDATAFGAATGLDFPDALSGGVFMGAPAHRGPILLVAQAGPLPTAVAGYLSASAPTLAAGYLFGGPLAVGPDVLTELGGTDTCGATLAGELTETGAATQLLTVDAPSYGSTTATFTAWQLEAGCWQAVYGPWTADVGTTGVSDHKREGDGRRRPALTASGRPCTGSWPIRASVTPTTSSCAGTGGTRTRRPPPTTPSSTSPARAAPRSGATARRCGRPFPPTTTSRSSTTTTTRWSPARDPRSSCTSTSAARRPGA